MMEAKVLVAQADVQATVQAVHDRVPMPMFEELSKNLASYAEIEVVEDDFSALWEKIEQLSDGMDKVSSGLEELGNATEQGMTFQLSLTFTTRIIFNMPNLFVSVQNFNFQIVFNSPRCLFHKK